MANPQMVKHAVSKLGYTVTETLGLVCYKDDSGALVEFNPKSPVRLMEFYVWMLSKGEVRVQESFDVLKQRHVIKLRWRPWVGQTRIQIKIEAETLADAFIEAIGSF